MFNIHSQHFPASKVHEAHTHPHTMLEHERTQLSRYSESDTVELLLRHFSEKGSRPERALCKNFPEFCNAFERCMLSRCAFVKSEQSQA